MENIGRADCAADVKHTKLIRSVVRRVNRHRAESVGEQRGAGGGDHIGHNKQKQSRSCRSYHNVEGESAPPPNDECSPATGDQPIPARMQGKSCARDVDMAVAADPWGLT
jgi:hypothetical protein